MVIDWLKPNRDSFFIALLLLDKHRSVRPSLSTLFFFFFGLVRLKTARNEDSCVHYKVVFLTVERSNYLWPGTKLDSRERGQCLASSFAQCTLKIHAKVHPVNSKWQILTLLLDDLSSSNSFPRPTLAPPNSEFRSRFCSDISIGIMQNQNNCWILFQ